MLLAENQPRTEHLIGRSKGWIQLYDNQRLYVRPLALNTVVAEPDVNRLLIAVLKADSPRHHRGKLSPNN